MKEIKINNLNSNQRIDKFVRKFLNDAPLSFIYKTFRKKDIKVNGHWVKENYILKDGDEVRIYVTDEQIEEFNNPKKIEGISFKDLEIIYEDENIIIVNKNKGILIHGDISEKRITLTNKVQSYCLSKSSEPSGCDFLWSPCHRLDRNTSGIVIYAKNLKSSQYFMELFKNKDKLSKYYLALVAGKTPKKGIINIPLKKDVTQGLVFKCPIKDGGKEAITEYETLKSNDKYSLVLVKLITGRTHQIRVHFKEIGHPLVGDGKYGDFSVNKEFKNEFNYDSQFLHAYKIELKNLDDGFEYLSNKSFIAPLRVEEINILKELNLFMDI